jgi:biofilm PGA synthesis N-glycosyltransferase PgaC
MLQFITYLLSIPVAITFVMTFLLLMVYIIKHKETKPRNIDLPKVSVLVPFYNEDSDLLIKALAMLDAQQYSRKLQVVLIDDGSSNSTPQQVLQWISQPRQQEYVWLQREKNGGRKGFALDYALASGLLTGDAYVVVDSDTFIKPDGVHELVSKLWSDDRYAAVCGYISPENHQHTLIGRLQYFEHIGFYGAIRAAQDKLGMVPVLAGAFVAHRASVVREIGGWSEWLVEDISWCWKALAAGHRTGYAANAVATTQCPQTSAVLFKQRRRWARGRVEAFVTAWKLSKIKGALFTPWFLLTALQFLFPPTLIMLPLLVYFNIWMPLLFTGATLLMYVLFTMIYMKRHGVKVGICGRDIACIPFFTAVLEMITWIPNVLGYADEMLGRKKIWLTR